MGMSTTLGQASCSGVASQCIMNSESFLCICFYLVIVGVVFCFLGSDFILFPLFGVFCCCVVFFLFVLGFFL